MMAEAKVIHVDPNVWMTADLDQIRILGAVLDRDHGSNFHARSRPIPVPNLPPVKAQTPREILRGNNWLSLEQVAIVIGAKSTRTVLNRMNAKVWGEIGTWSKRTLVIDETPYGEKHSYRFHYSLFEPGVNTDAPVVKTVARKPRTRSNQPRFSEMF